MWLKVVRKSQAYIDPDLDPVLLVPGVAGSVLHAVDESGHGERVWIRLFGADYKLRTRLWSRFDPSTGKTVSLDPKTNVVVPEDRYGLYAIDVLDPDMLIECPSIYELMPCSEFGWEHLPLLQIWREKLEDNKDSNAILESYAPDECIQIFNEALSTNTVDYQGVTIPLPFNLEILKWASETRKILSDAKVPAGVKFYNIYGTSLDTPHSVCYGSEVSPIVELEELRYLQADGLNAEARVGVPGEHRGILCERYVFRILKHWLRAGELDPYYDPVNDFVILPTAFEVESHEEKRFHIEFVKEEWEFVSADPEGEQGNMLSQHDVFTAIVNDLNQANHCLESRNSSVTWGHAKVHLPLLFVYIKQEFKLELHVLFKDVNLNCLCCNENGSYRYMV